MQCERSFPQQLNLLSLVQADITDQNSSSYRNWTRVLNNGQLASDQESWNSCTQAAAALLILSIFWVVLTIALTLASKNFYPGKILTLNLLDAVLVLTAAALWTAAVSEATQDYKSYRKYGTNNAVSIGPGIWLLWAICVAKICVIPAIALFLFIILPGLCLIGWCLNCANPDDRPGEDFCCDAICCLCCED
jgi:hypothetical protein